MEMKEKQFAEILEQALALLEKGKAREEILALFPEQEKELAEIFAVLSGLEKSKEKIIPPRALLEKIVANADNKQKVGRPSLLHNNFNFMNWKITLPVGAALIVLAIFAFSQGGEKKSNLNIAKNSPAAVQEKTAAVEKNSANPAAEAGSEAAESESIDSIIDSLASDSIDEQIALADEDADASLIDIDQEEINNLNQIYDEKEF